MKIFLLLLAAFAEQGGAEPKIPWNYLTVNFQQFYHVPTTLAEMRSGEFPDYVLMAHDADLNLDLYSWPQDPRVSFMYDTHGIVAGVRIAWIKEDLPKMAEARNMTFPYHFEDQGGLYEEGTYWGIPLWYASVLFADPETLKSGGRDKITDVFADHLFMKLDDKWTDVPRDQCNLTATLPFYPQQCIEHMGFHYTHHANLTTHVSHYTGLNVMFHEGELVALSLSPFGATTNRDRDWWEHTTGERTKKATPNTPDNMKEWVDDFGLAAVHVRFTDPRAYTCNNQSQVPDRCKREQNHKRPVQILED